MGLVLERTLAGDPAVLLKTRKGRAQRVPFLPTLLL